MTSDLDSPVMTETSVVTHLLQSFEILSEPGVDDVGNELRPGTVLNAVLSVEEPFGDAVFKGLGEDVGDFVHLGFSELSSARVDVDLGDLADQDGESSTYTLDDSDGEWHLVSSVDVGVQHSQNMSEILSVL